MITWTPLDYEEGVRCNLPEDESLATFRQAPTVIKHIYKVNDDTVEVLDQGNVNTENIIAFGPFNLPE